MTVPHTSRRARSQRRASDPAWHEAQAAGQEAPSAARSQLPASPPIPSGPIPPALRPAVLDALATLRAKGFDAEFLPDPAAIPPGIWCRRCGRRHLPGRALVSEAHPFDRGPGEGALLVALTCPRCAARGALVVAEGAGAGTAEAELVTALRAVSPSRGGRVP